MLYFYLFYPRLFGQRSVHKTLETEKLCWWNLLNAYKLLERDIQRYRTLRLFIHQRSVKKKCKHDAERCEKADESISIDSTIQLYAMRNKKQFLFTVSANSIRKHNIFIVCSADNC